jgi:hypothetical protein
MIQTRTIRTAKGTEPSPFWGRLTPKAVVRLFLAAFLWLCVGTEVGAAQCPQIERSGTDVPAEGYVPDSTTAVRIAEAVLTPIYSAAQLTTERPFGARLSNGIWTVLGTLPPTGRPGEERVGGVAVVKLCKADGRILLVTHEK